MHYNRLEDILAKMRRSGHVIDSIFDVGANQGSWSLQWKKVYPNASFTMFEANPAHKKPTWLGLGDRWINTVLTKPGVSEVAFYRMPNLEHRGTGDSYYIENTPHYKNSVATVLEATTLDDIVSSQGIPHPQFIKLDTQGSEVDIIQGAQETFKSVDVCITEVPIVDYNKGAPTFDVYLSLLRGMGFSPVAIDQDHYSNGTLIQIDIVFVKTKLMHMIQ